MSSAHSADRAIELFLDLGPVGPQHATTRTSRSWRRRVRTFSSGRRQWRLYARFPVFWPADSAYVTVGRRHGLEHQRARAVPGVRKPFGSTVAAAIYAGQHSDSLLAAAAGRDHQANQWSTTFRNAPDVSANANFTFYVCADQTACTANEYGGTSFAAPMWAGYLALANRTGGCQRR